MLDVLNEENTLFYVKTREYTQIYKNSYYFSIFNYVRVYSYLFKKISFDVSIFFQKMKKKNDRVLYTLILTFKKNKIFINLNDYLKINYFFMSSGFFIKYFEKKKTLKKGKIIRTLMIRYLRKIFILVNIPRTILMIKKTPIFLMEFLNFFCQPIPYKFNEPLTKKEIRDSETPSNVTNFLFFIFLNSKNYTFCKLKKKGRIKRKISRKIALKNFLID